MHAGPNASGQSQGRWPSRGDECDKATPRIACRMRISRGAGVQPPALHLLWPTPIASHCGRVYATSATSKARTSFWYPLVGRQLRDWLLRWPPELENSQGHNLPVVDRQLPRNKAAGNGPIDCGALGRATRMPHVPSRASVRTFSVFAGLRSQSTSRKRLPAGLCMAYLDQPTEPSRLMPISFCVSAMNSIGKCCSTSRTKPLTIIATASSPLKPRCRQ